LKHNAETAIGKGGKGPTPPERAERSSGRRGIGSPEVIYGLGAGVGKIRLQKIQLGGKMADEPRLAHGPTSDCIKKSLGRLG